MTPSTLTELFAAMVARHPAAPAVSDGADQLSYAELDRRAGLLAAALRQQGVGPEDRVGLHLDRGVDMVVAVLGILQAGAAYLPVDTRYPAARRDLLLDDAGIAALITTPELRERLAEPSHPVLDMSANAAPGPARGRPVEPGDAACVLYTSGSTGAPKGIVLEHRQILAFACDPALPVLGPGARMGQISSISFDALNLELWRSFAAGAELVVLPKITDLMAADLSRELRRRRITALLVTSAAVNQVVREDREAFAPLRILYVGGDVVLPDTCRDILAGSFAGELYNLYGPTEATTACSVYRVRDLPADAASVPIGHALAGADLHVLSPGLRPVRRGASGELHVGGRGVARGYLNRPALTAERFLPDPFTGGRMYATGDLVRENERGELEFLGRRDDQVKIRGQRVEPGEVERALARHPDVRDACVLVDAESGDKRLVAFLVPAGESMSLKELRRFLLDRLSDVMVPADFVVLPNLPTDAHGKRDRAALAELLAARTQQCAEYVAPRDDVERYLVGLWEELLVTEHIGVLDDFFSLGGHSLLAFRAHAQIKRELGIPLDFAELLENSVLCDLARVIVRTRATPTSS